MPQIQQASQLDQLLKFLLESLQQGKDFTMEQAPQFVQEILTWRYYEALFYIGLGVALFLVGVIAFFVVRRAAKGTEAEGIEILPLAIGGVVAFIMIAVNSYTAIQVTVAPRVVLVSMVREMLR